MPEGMTTADRINLERALAPDRTPAPPRPDVSPVSGSRGRLSRRGLIRVLLMGGAALVLLIGGLWYWLSGGRYVTTTDAYVQADVLNVSTDVSGVVQDIAVHDGERVKAGQLLFRLDPLKFQLAVDQARANLEQTKLDLESLKADYLRALQVRAAQAAQVQGDQATFNRAAELVKTRAMPPQQYDEARFKLLADEAQLGSAEAQVKAALAKLGGNADLPVTEMPAYKTALAQLGEAQRQLQHSVVRAPYDGTVTQVDKLQLGQVLQAGTAAFGLVGTNNFWVAAEPKETELTYARPGDPAKVTVDAYPGVTWQGEVQSIAPATDQQFSLLPAQNSSGNWVKVVQRVPVRVTLKPVEGAPPLSAGMSTEVTIDTGHTRHLSDLF
ncbi:MAG TPA: HlyD family secretion protein [Acetobacteraceae bacterium]|nr:HlyD family secretion protein [Acetobacteraceae bacterium]